MNTDPIFEPGDKVVKVRELTIEELSKIDRPPNAKSQTKTGIIYCVKKSWYEEGFGRVDFIGFDTLNAGFWSRVYRKVSEVGHPAIAMVNEEVRREHRNLNAVARLPALRSRLHDS